MKHTIFLSFLLFLSLSLFSQIKFETGYYINQNGSKIDCLIKNQDWLKDPKGISVKLTEASEIQEIKLNELKGFEVGNQKYLKFVVDYDQSYFESALPETTENPEYVKKEVLLKVLIEGDASLYKLGNEQRFYYQMADSGVQHLVYKRYVVDAKLKENVNYKKQLLEAFRSDCISVLDVRELDFNQKDLMAVFEKYNSCNGNSTYVFKKAKRKNPFRLYLKPGVRYASASIENESFPQNNNEFDGAINPVFSVGLEYVLPFNKDKWSLILQPTYQYFHSTSENVNHPMQRIDELKYNSIEFPIGFRYKMYLSDISSLYLDASLVLVDIPLNSEIINFDIVAGINMIGGVGYNYKNLGIEFQYSSSRNLMLKYPTYIAPYKSMSMMVYYVLFKN